MAHSTFGGWCPTAAYLYILHLDAQALAWEYLRRNPDYQNDWQHLRRHPKAGYRWGLRLLEPPELDAREAHPIWFPDHDCIQLYPDIDPLPDAMLFRFWHIPGAKHLIYDAKRLMLWIRWPGVCLRLQIAPRLAHGMAYVYAIRASASRHTFDQSVTTELNELALTGGVPIVEVRSRPTLSALQELRTLQALDATLAGASLREVGKVLFGAEVVAEDWHADSALRARVRRLVRRGERMMRGGYRHFARIPMANSGGRSINHEKRP